MLHKNVAPSSSNLGPCLVEPLHLVQQARSARVSQAKSARKTPALGLDLVTIVSRRCSAFFAEAAVLVLVFGILDYFILKGRMELPWIIGVFAVSLGLLAGSILMELSARRWIGAHP